MALAQGTRIDDYELVEHLADGATAEMHRAIQISTGATVALKIPRRDALASPARVHQWRREAKLTAALDHPNINRRVDLDRYRSRPYLAFEYAGGGSLRHWLAAGEPLPVDQVVEWGRELAEALRCLHERRHVHADLKPENLLLTDDLELQLADVGSAVRMGRLPFAPPRQVLELPEGTPEYLSPEQIQGRQLDERSDVYSWGVVMYELLTGTCPFRGDTPIEVMTAHLQDHPVPVHARRPDLSKGLSAVVMTAMRRQSDRRHPDTTALLRDLGEHSSLDPATRDLDPEPTEELGAGGPGSSVWPLVVAVTATYLVVLIAILGIVAIAH
jgi:serine/threonine-protein kinase